MTRCCTFGSHVVQMPARRCTFRHTHDCRLWRETMRSLTVWHVREWVPAASPATFCPQKQCVAVSAILSRMAVPRRRRAGVANSSSQCRNAGLIGSSHSHTDAGRLVQRRAQSRLAARCRHSCGYSGGGGTSSILACSCACELMACVTLRWSLGSLLVMTWAGVGVVPCGGGGSATSGRLCVTDSYSRHNSKAWLVRNGRRARGPLRRAPSASTTALRRCGASHTSAHSTRLPACTRCTSPPQRKILRISTICDLSLIHISEPTRPY